MDLAHALKLALQSGTVRLGAQETLAAATRKEARLVVVSTTCPEPKLGPTAKFDRLPVFRYPGTAVELGAACGKPFPISALAVIDPGQSAILTLET
jgi:large subunit ribosomal protein L30e